jgi:hypothetical protein
VLGEFYLLHNPDKIDDVGALLAFYKVRGAARRKVEGKRKGARSKVRGKIEGEDGRGMNEGSKEVMNQEMNE